jgi:hypothetical protein
MNPQSHPIRRWTFFIPSLLLIASLSLTAGQAIQRRLTFRQGSTP